ncbi:MAG: RNA methyltransferase [Planctomycetes bacterium]|nr:RNA methyltransferase [Planctomycetota bacterium]
MKSPYHVPCPLGLQEVLAEELRDLGAKDVSVRPGAVDFSGSREVAYRACLWVRSGIRIQEGLLKGEVARQEDLYRLVRGFPWERLISVDQTLSVRATGQHSAFNDLRYPALVVKDAVVDRFRELERRRPSVDRRVPDLPLRVHLGERTTRIYRDLAGSSLHKRGWRPVQVKSPLNEALAAGLLLLSGWDRASTLLDPMCGSGTFVVEAAMIASERAPGLGRGFACERWRDYDRGLMERLRSEARARAKPTLPFTLYGSDRHSGALQLAADGARAARVHKFVHFDRADVRAFEPAEPPSVVMVNPPYGQRLGEGEDLIESWRELGRLLRERCPGATAYVLSGEPELTRHLGMKASRRYPVMNGPISCRLLRYEINEP